MTEDAALLRRYAENRDEAAFAELVRRNIDAVYSTALRRAGQDAHLAQDIVQQVFVVLARDARRLVAHPVLTGWLHTVTRNVAVNAVRGERRRKQREQEAHVMEEVLSVGADPDWRQVAPVLEQAIDTLEESDRVAVLLRFLDRRSYPEIGRALGIGEDGARKRVERALEKLRGALAGRGVASTAAALGGVLTQSAVTAAPAGLAATVTTAAVGAAGSAAAGFFTFMSLTKVQIAAALVVGGTAGWWWQQSRIDQLDSEVTAMRARLAAPKTENRPPTQSPPDSAASLVAAQAEVTSTKLAAAPPRNGSKDATPTPPATPPSTGGNLMSVEARVTRLDSLVRLTPEQKVKIAAIFQKENNTLDALPREDRGLKGMDARQASRAEVRQQLTPEQRKKYDISPQTLGGGLPVNPEFMVAQLDEAVHLTYDQKKKATEIIWDDITDQVAALPDGQPLRGFRWSDKVRDRLRELLAAEQQAKFDATAPYGKNARRN